VGCSSKVNVYQEPQDVLHEQALTQTQKVVMKLGTKEKAFITATYINEIEHELAGFNTKLERFLITIYVPSDENQSIYNEISFNVTGSDENGNVRQLKNDDPLLALLPSSNPWDKNYLFETKTVKTKVLTLNFKHKMYGTVYLRFQKNDL
jgi:hypothetical protein